MANTDSGFDGFNGPSSTDWEEHGAQGDRSDGRKFKKVQSVPMSVIIDDVDENTSYFGFAKPGTTTSEAFWKIMKKVKSGTVTSFTFANGTDSFVNVWTDRTSLTYS